MFLFVVFTIVQPCSGDGYKIHIYLGHVIRKISVLLQIERALTMSNVYGTVTRLTALLVLEGDKGDTTNRLQFQCDPVIMTVLPYQSACGMYLLWESNNSV